MNDPRDYVKTVRGLERKSIKVILHQRSNKTERNTPTVHDLRRSVGRTTVVRLKDYTSNSKVAYIIYIQEKVYTPKVHKSVNSLRTEKKENFVRKHTVL